MTVAFCFSPRTAYAFVKLVKEAGLGNACRHITACSLSAAAAEPLRAFDWQRMITAVRPDSESLLDCIVPRQQEQR